MTLGVTGHRPKRLGSGVGWTPLRCAVVAKMAMEIDRLKPTRLISGMALVTDQWAAALAHKRGGPFDAAVPFETQSAKWTRAQFERYKELLGLAASVTYTNAGHSCDFCARELIISALHSHWYDVRNQWIVDRCDVLLAVWDGSNSGTGNCVRYAERVGREVVRIDPRELKLERTGVTL